MPTDSVPPAVTPPAPVAVPGPPASPLGGVWAELRQCESGGNYAIDTGNGFYGAYQFSAATWHGLGFTGLPNQAPPAVQDEAAVELQARERLGPVAGLLPAPRAPHAPGRLPRPLVGQPLVQPVEDHLGRESDVVGLAVGGSTAPRR